MLAEVLDLADGAGADRQLLGCDVVCPDCGKARGLRARIIQPVISLALGNPFALAAGNGRGKLFADAVALHLDGPKAAGFIPDSFALAFVSHIKTPPFLNQRNGNGAFI